MLTREQRAKKSAMWLAHWQDWQGSGLSMAEYARERGVDAQEAYRWKRVLKRTGQWTGSGDGEAEAAPIATRKRKAAPRFARVVVSEPSRPPAAVLMRLVLRNGRHAELQVSGITQLAELIGVLERAA